MDSLYSVSDFLRKNIKGIVMNLNRESFIHRLTHVIFDSLVPNFQIITNQFKFQFFLRPYLVDINNC